MKWALFFAGPVVAALAVAACGKMPPAAPATPEPEMKKGHPVVHLPPVETRPFEEGYEAGYEYGRKHATPKTAVPSEEDSNREAAGQGAGQPDRWLRGFAQGYTDGVRNVVTGQK